MTGPTVSPHGAAVHGDREERSRGGVGRDSIGQAAHHAVEGERHAHAAGARLEGRRRRRRSVRRAAASSAAAGADGPPARTRTPWRAARAPTTRGRAARRRPAARRCVKPAGIAIAGNPVLGLSWQFDPSCASPMIAGLRRSVGYASASSCCSSIAASTSSRTAVAPNPRAPVGVGLARRHGVPPREGLLERRVVAAALENLAERVHGRVRKLRQIVHQVELELRVDDARPAEQIARGPEWSPRRSRRRPRRMASIAARTMPPTSRSSGVEPNRSLRMPMRRPFSASARRPSR